MHESDRLQLTTLIEKRISVLESTLSDHHSISDRKRSQAGDAAANLDLTINASVDEKILSEHKLELVQLTKSLSWMQTDDAGVCAQCGCNIPTGRLKAVLNARLCVACAGNNRN
jgi:RNA polymerase-binding transcription factor DksA